MEIYTHDIQKIVVITDPTNPDPEIMKHVKERGHILSELHCSDGLVFLVKTHSDEIFTSVEKIEDVQAPLS